MNGPLRYTGHALQRMAQMALDREDVADVLRRPDLSYPSSKLHPNSETRRVHVRGDLAVVTDDGDRMVITVLWHRKDAR